ncbi:MAG: Wzz/FepE/Etk N-terminal domain-containing protein, partial [Caldimonas manganoxidans]|nr:Wzz/FepE/Etk N-terminal domain-containing protein [Caldimonas manganoxidans]
MPQLTPLQYLRMIWARKWLVLAVFVTVATAGIATVLSLPKQYTAEARLVVDMRPDPVLGGLAAPFSMATELEVLRSDVVAARVVKALGMLDDPKVIQDWREKTDAKMPLDRYLAGFIQRSMTVEPVRGSNVIAVKFSHGEPAVAAAAANALAQAAIDVSVEMRVGPARQSASWFEDQARALRNELEAAQARLSKFQQQAGIVVT